MRIFISSLLAITLCSSANAQLVDHWETAIYNTNTWSFIIPGSEPEDDWIDIGFDIDDWQTGVGGIGYGDGDDNTVVPSPQSVFMRTNFMIDDLSVIGKAVLHMDYDDGFVAYMNGVEIARANCGFPGEFIPFDYGTIEYHEAAMYGGGLPEEFLFNTDWLVEGENVLALKVFNASSPSSDFSSNAFLSFGITTGDTYFSPTPPWFYEPFLSTNLPLVYINTGGSEILDEPKIEVDLGIIWNGDGATNNIGDAFNNYNGQAFIEIRGSSSQSFPKKSYSFELFNPVLETNLNASLLGLPSDDDWILYGPYTDKTFLRDVLTYYLGGKQGYYEPRFKFCELFLNNQYQGIYVLLEKIKIQKDRIDIHKMTPDDNDGVDVTGGYVLKVDRNDYASPVQDYFYSPYPGTGWPYDVMYVYVDPKPEEITLAQKNYIEDYIIGFEDVMNSPDMDDPYEGYAKYIDINSFVDYLMVNEMSRNVDAYRLSTYFYKNNDQFGGLLYAGPLWDFNLAWGNADYCTAWTTDGFFTDCGTGPAWWYDLFDDENFQNRLSCRWNELREGPFHTDSILAWIDTQETLLSAAAERNYIKWPILGTYVWPNYYIGSTFEEEVNYLKNYIDDRLNWIDTHIPGDAAACDIAGLTEIAVTEINYNSDNLNESNDWIELHNYGNSAIDISSWKLKDETAFNSYVIPPGTMLDPNEYLVLVEDIDTFLMIHPDVTNYVGPFNFGLDNTSGSVRIEDNIGNVIRQINYIDSVPWPKGSDGYGPTLQIADEMAAENNPANWFASCVLGTPGEDYTPCNYPVVIAEINYNSAPDYNAGDWAEIWNIGPSDIDMSGWILKDMNNGNAFVFPNGTNLPADIRIIVSDSLESFTIKFPWATNVLGEPDFHFSNGGDALRLYDQTGKIQFSVRYNDKAPWPTDADGLGFTLECVNVSDNPNFATNWVAGCLFGTPGFFFSLPCGDGIEETELPAFSIYPNPFINFVEIIIDENIDSESVYITDMTGKRVIDFNSSQDHFTWNGENNFQTQVAAGIYYLNVITGDGNYYSAEIVKIK